MSSPLINQKGPASALPLRLGLAAGEGTPVLGAAFEVLLGGTVGIVLLAYYSRAPVHSSAA